MKFTNETKIGILVSVVIVILSVLTWKTGNYSFVPDGYMVKARFSDVQGISKNAPVTLNGLEEGRVENVKVIYGDIPQIELSLWLKSEAKIPQNAKASIRMMGFMGEKYVAIEMTDTKSGFLKPGDVIIGQEPASMEKLLAEGVVMAKNLTVISEEIKSHLQNHRADIDEMIGDLHGMSKNLNSITTNVDERLSVNRSHIDDMIKNLNSTSMNLEEMSYDLKQNPWKLLYKAKESKKSLKDKVAK